MILSVGDIMIHGIHTHGDGADHIIEVGMPAGTVHGIHGAGVGTALGIMVGMILATHGVGAIHTMDGALDSMDTDTLTAAETHSERAVHEAECYLVAGIMALEDQAMQLLCVEEVAQMAQCPLMAATV